MAQVTIQGRTVEVPDNVLINALQGARNQATDQPGNYPITPRNEYRIQTDDGKISQNELGDGVEVMDFNDGRNKTMRSTWHSCV